MRMTPLAALGLCAALVTPASADVGVGSIATITVDETAGACVSVSGSGTIAGEFSASGFVTAIIQDGVVKPAVIAGAKPLTRNGSSCIAGVGGAHSVRGEVVYTVVVADSTGDYTVEVKVCTFGGPLPCI